MTGKEQEYYKFMEKIFQKAMEVQVDYDNLSEGNKLRFNNDMNIHIRSLEIKELIRNVRNTKY